MGLRLKFNLVLVIVFLAGFAAVGLVSRQLLQNKAREEVLRNARLIMDTALAARAYSAEQVKPYLGRPNDTVLSPHAAPGNAAAETLNQFQKKYRDYGYKEATLNPNHPRNRATDWEADIILQFRQHPEFTEWVSERGTGSDRILHIAQPIQVSHAACLQCHGAPAAAKAGAPRAHVAGPGVGWKHKDIVGAQMVSVPMNIPALHAGRAFQTFMAALAGVFALTFIALNVMLSWLIVRPIQRMAQAADKVSTGDFDVPEFSGAGGDEVALLGSAFNRMRRSLEKAMRMIERGGN